MLHASDVDLNRSFLPLLRPELQAAAMRALYLYHFKPIVLWQINCFIVFLALLPLMCNISFDGKEISGTSGLSTCRAPLG
jgi:hypothetical protein